MFAQKKTIAILQSNYIPWKGYFDIINMVDEFVIYDDVQFTKNDWRNRNTIKTPRGISWLTIPVESKGRLTDHKKINEIQVADSIWYKKHWSTLINNYKDAEYFKNTKEEIFEAYEFLENEPMLSEINVKLIRDLCKFLKIQTSISLSTDYSLPEDRNLRLIELCYQLKATHYLSGPAAKNYLDEKLFNDNGIQVIWMDYSGYSEYSQLYPPFEHGVSILDLIFNEGPNASKYMKSF